MIREISLETSEKPIFLHFAFNFEKEDPCKKKYLELIVIDADNGTWKKDLYNRDKPEQVDCVVEYLELMHSLFLQQKNNHSIIVYDFQDGVLKMKEKLEIGFALIANVQFQEINHPWEAIRQILRSSQQSYDQVAQTCQQFENQVVSLQDIIAQKDTLLQAALTAKKELEDIYFSKFILVLNEKKKEIQRLQTLVNKTSSSSPTSSTDSFRKKDNVKKHNVKTTMSKKRKKEQEDDLKMQTNKKVGSRGKKKINKKTITTSTSSRSRSRSCSSSRSSRSCSRSRSNSRSSRSKSTRSKKNGRNMEKDESTENESLEENTQTSSVAAMYYETLPSLSSQIMTSEELLSSFEKQQDIPKSMLLPTFLRPTEINNPNPTKTMHPTTIPSLSTETLKNKNEKQPESQEMAFRIENQLKLKSPSSLENHHQVFNEKKKKKKIIEESKEEKHSKKNVPKSSPLVLPSHLKKEEQQWSNDLSDEDLFDMLLS